jgi:hypothetical protein
MAKRHALSVICVSVCVLAVTPAVGHAAEAQCQQSLIRDWYVDGRIQGDYAAGCYRSALARVPSGGTVYGNVRADLSNGLASAVTHQRGSDKRHSDVYPVVAGILLALLAAWSLTRWRSGRVKR